ncbi:hypothetical protein MPSEU_000347100 [Mayamaea pseudoterrestris]|nr:hypothetical protein MPSEU_000347100 [Mayamaea pseudoterrestris]
MPNQVSEEAAEFVATVRTEHVSMKRWFQTSAAADALRAKYGDYPSLWKEVLNWDGWKETRREYMKEQQLKERNDSRQQQVQGDPAVPRKRKSRWGTADSATNNIAADDANKRNSRWGDGANAGAGGPVSQQPPSLAPVLPGLNALPPDKSGELEQLRGRLREINHILEKVDDLATHVDNLPRGHRERSPSPPPIYGPDGMRQNTRAVRWRQKYTYERQDLLEKIMRLQGAGPNQMLVRKRTKKISIPFEKHPTYNFIGLIIGPRGKTQKELETKTGCKIAIRGRGSVKEGARGRRDGKLMEGDNEPLHVVITGDDQHAVDAAGDMIEQMLVVIDDEKNVHKQQQLRELALLNGTLKDDEFCTICAEKGHREFECPRKFGMKNKEFRQLIKCAICGDTSHPTRDCTQIQTTVDTKQSQQVLDTEYLSFMAELDGKKAVTTENTAISAPPKPTNLPPPPPPMPSKLPLPTGVFQPPPIGVNAQLLPPHGRHAPPLPNPPPQTTNNVTAAASNYYRAPPPVPQEQQQYGQQPSYGGLPPSHQYGHPVPLQELPGKDPRFVPQEQPPVQPGQEGAAWDPSAYYGHEQGAGGFNWWEQ